MSSSVFFTEPSSIRSTLKKNTHFKWADVISIDKSGDFIRLLYDTKGRFVLHRLSEEEVTFKLARVNKDDVTKNQVRTCSRFYTIDSLSKNDKVTKINK